ncbi:WD repeat-containing protein 25 [Arapaima gigas]
MLLIDFTSAFYTIIPQQLVNKLLVCPLLFSLLTHGCVAKYNCNHIIKYADDSILVGLIVNKSAYRGEVEQPVLNRAMISLVAYQSSDSEDEITEQEGVTSQNSKIDCAVKSSQGRKEPLDEPLPWIQDGGLESTTSGAFGELSTSHCIKSVCHQSGSGPALSSSQTLQSSGCVRSLKRPQPSVASVRPYMPKRLRVPIQEAGSSMVTNLGCCSAGPSLAPRSKLLTEVSESVRPYLRQRSKGTELPRNVRLQIQAHQGPVNVVQWCPMPHLSHLLLSASLDKTAKIWDAAGSGQCLFTCTSHCGAVRDACWTPCGRRFLTGSFDDTAHLTDVETGQQIVKMRNQFKVTCLAIHPNDPNVVLCGGFSSEVKAWDTRTCKVVRTYQAGIQQTLDILFLAGGKEFVISSDSVSRDSAERTLIAWDFQTTAKVSNQIFHERYTCPSMALHPQDNIFVAQTNGNYIALFAAQRPYRMNKRKRYEGHKVEGYAVGCEFSPDGTVLVSGSSTGLVHVYDQQSTRELRVLRAHEQACLCATMHPVLPAVLASSDWVGELIIWH